MPSEFLKNRLPEFLLEIGGEETVTYTPVDSSSADSLTGEINPATAYAGTPVKLPALIDHSPSEAMRKKLGLEIDVDATLIVATRHIENNGISFAVGDAFDLPPDNDRLYVTKVVPSYQSGNLFLAYLLAVSRKQGRR